MLLELIRIKRKFGYLPYTAMAVWLEWAGRYQHHRLPVKWMLLLSELWNCVGKVKETDRNRERQRERQRERVCVCVCGGRAEIENSEVECVVLELLLLCLHFGLLAEVQA